MCVCMLHGMCVTWHVCVRAHMQGAAVSSGRSVVYYFSYPSGRSPQAVLSGTKSGRNSRLQCSQVSGCGTKDEVMPAVPICGLKCMLCLCV